MLLAMVDDIRVILVKLADRLHNMRTLELSVSPSGSERIARETIDIYAPIAHRLGMGKIRGELEDLAFQHLEPDALRGDVRQPSKPRRMERRVPARDRQTRRSSKLRREGIPGARRMAASSGSTPSSRSCSGRRSRVDQVYDLLALRIITDSVQELLRGARA